MEILIWQERLHLLRKGKFLPLTAFEATSSRHSKRFNSKIFIALHESGQCISSCLHEIMCLIWGHPQYHVASFKLRLFFICCKSISEQKKLIMANKMWSRAKNIFKQTNKQTKHHWCGDLCFAPDKRSCKLTRMKSRLWDRCLIWGPTQFTWAIKSGVF